MASDNGTTEEGPANAEDGVATQEVIVEDLIHAHVAQSYMGTVMMDVRSFDTAWPEQGSNREIDPEHVSKLIEKFKSGIRRCAAETRLKASTSRETFYQCIRPKMQGLGYSDESEWKGILTVMYGSTENDIVEIEWPEGMKKPFLDCGQHRRAALVQVLKNQIKEARQLADEGKPNIPVVKKVK